MRTTELHGRTFDVVIAGAGHNGLVAGAILARRGKRVLIAERADVLGGACRTERPFAIAPELGCSTGAYLLGPMPPEVLEATGLAGRVRLMPRRPHGYFLLPDGAPVAFGVPDGGGLTHLHTDDRRALDDLDAVLGAIRDDLAPLWLREAVTLEESVEHVRATPAPRHIGGTVRDLYRVLALGETGDARPSGSVGEFLDRFRFRSEFLKAVVATDGLVGSMRGVRDPGSGMNFLAHNMLRLPAGDGRGTSPLGAWQLVEGGMGAITGTLAAIVREHGGEIRTGAPVREVHLSHGAVESVEIDGVGEVQTGTLIIATDPTRAIEMLGGEAQLRMRSIIEPLGEQRGSSLKVNMALRALPKVVGADVLSKTLGREVQALSGTVHVLPTERTLERLEAARTRAVEHGQTPEPSDAMIDVYTHTAVDPSLQDAQGRHAMSLFVQWVPSGISALKAEEFAWSLIRGPVARVLPDLPELVEEIFVLGPSKIEERFGIRGGHIHHVDNGYAFDRRLGCRTPVQGVLLAGAGCHPAGSVIGASGYIAAELAQADCGSDAHRSGNNAS